MIKKEYALKISRFKIEPIECGKWYSHFYNRAIVNAKCPININFNNVGDYDFHGGYLEIALNVHHRVFVGGCVVVFDEYKLPCIKKGDVFKVKSWISLIGSCDKTFC